MCIRDRALTVSILTASVEWMAEVTPATTIPANTGGSTIRAAYGMMVSEAISGNTVFPRVPRNGMIQLQKPMNRMVMMVERCSALLDPIWTALDTLLEPTAPDIPVRNR